MAQKLESGIVTKLSGMQLNVEPERDVIIIQTEHVADFVDATGGQTPLTKELIAAGIDVRCDSRPRDFGGDSAEIHGERSLQILKACGVQYTGSERYSPLPRAFSLREAVRAIQTVLSERGLKIKQNYTPSGALLFPPALRDLLLNETPVREAFLEAGMEPVPASGAHGAQIKCDREQLTRLAEQGLEFPGAAKLLGRESGAAAQR